MKLLFIYDNGEKQIIQTDNPEKEINEKEPLEVYELFPYKGIDFYKKELKKLIKKMETHPELLNNNREKVQEMLKKFNKAYEEGNIDTIKNIIDHKDMFFIVGLKLMDIDEKIKTLRKRITKTLNH